MINFDGVTEENVKENNPNWPQVPNLFLIIRGFRSGKAIALFNLISRQPYIDKIYLYTKEPHEVKYQLLFSKHEGAGLKYRHDSKAFMEYLNDTDDIYKNIEKCSPGED